MINWLQEEAEELVEAKELVESFPEDSFITRGLASLSGEKGLDSCMVLAGLATMEAGWCAGSVGDGSLRAAAALRVSPYRVDFCLLFRMMSCSVLVIGSGPMVSASSAILLTCQHRVTDRGKVVSK